MGTTATLINEELAAQSLLRGLLEADSQLRGMVNAIYYRMVPKTVPVPIIKIDRLDASDLVELGMHRVWTDITYYVRGITTYATDPDWSVVTAIANRIENVLNEATTSDSTATIYLVRREEPRTEETFESGTYYQHGGGIYRLYAQGL